MPKNSLALASDLLLIAAFFLSSCKAISSPEGASTQTVEGPGMKRERVCATVVDSEPWLSFKDLLTGDMDRHMQGQWLMSAWTIPAGADLDWQSGCAYQRWVQALPLAANTLRLSEHKDTFCVRNGAVVTDTSDGLPEQIIQGCIEVNSPLDPVGGPEGSWQKVP